jgi:hypothetical protein
MIFQLQDSNSAFYTTRCCRVSKKIIPKIIL